MPKRTDIHKILIIGSGPIVIGQACEFDYSGTQACKALREEGYEIVLVNSNPATIMTDPELADRTYIEPLTAEFVAAIIKRERPDALLPTVGGQTALNLAVELVGQRHSRRIQSRDDRRQGQGREDGRRSPAFQAGDGARSASRRRAVKSSAISAKRSAWCSSIGFPVVIRPSFTLGGTGGGIAFNGEEFEEHRPARAWTSVRCTRSWSRNRSSDGKNSNLRSCATSRTTSSSSARSKTSIRWACTPAIPITVAPAQTLTDREYQRMRDAAVAVIRQIGVETGGSNIQFAVNPKDGRLVVIEMNPRVSRSSALASKATGFPIAKIAAKLAVGYTLNEIPNDITKKTPASFEPMLDYVVVKIPKWAFEKFPESDPTLGTQMKSVGEVMAIGRTFKEAFLKGVRSLETGKDPGSEIIDKESHPAEAHHADAGPHSLSSARHRAMVSAFQNLSS